MRGKLSTLAYLILAQMVISRQQYEMNKYHSFRGNRWRSLTAFNGYSQSFSKFFDFYQFVGLEDKYPFQRELSAEMFSVYKRFLTSPVRIYTYRFKRLHFSSLNLLSNMSCTASKPGWWQRGNARKSEENLMVPFCTHLIAKRLTIY